MRPDRCGFGRDPATFDPQTRKVVEGFERFLAGEMAIDADGNFVELDDPAAVRVAPKLQDPRKDEA